MVLSPQKEQFITEYLLDGDAIRAAIRSGYDEDDVQAVAEQWLADSHVVAALVGHQVARAAATGINDHWLRTQLLTIVERCMQPHPVLVGTANGMEHARSAQGEGLWRFDSMGAAAALELLGKHVGFFGRHNQQQHLGFNTSGSAMPTTGSTADVIPEA